MCLITNNKKEILKEDLTVYKVFMNTHDTSILSIHMHFVYEFDKLYKEDILSCDDWTFADFISSCHVLKGLNLDTTFPKPSQTMHLSKHGYVSYGPGFHSYRTVKRCITRRGSDWFHKRLFECVIPAGSEIIDDGTGNIVSNAIIIKRFVDTVRNIAREMKDAETAE